MGEQKIYKGQRYLYNTRYILYGGRKEVVRILTKILKIVTEVSPK